MTPANNAISHSASVDRESIRTKRKVLRNCRPDHTRLDYRWRYCHTHYAPNKGVSIKYFMLKPIE